MNILFCTVIHLSLFKCNIKYLHFCISAFSSIFCHCIKLFFKYYRSVDRQAPGLSFRLFPIVKEYFFCCTQKQKITLLCSRSPARADQDIQRLQRFLKRWAERHNFFHVFSMLVPSEELCLDVHFFTFSMKEMIGCVYVIKKSQRYSMLWSEYFEI